MSKWKLPFYVVPILVLVFAGQAEAACESEHRVSEEDSECMSESHTDGWYRVYNQCTHIIKAKIDVANGTDVTKDVPAAASQYGKIEGTISTTLGRYIRAVSCCSDHSTCDHQ